MRVVAGMLAGALLALTACGPSAPERHDYQIVVQGSATPVPVKFAGSYTCDNPGAEQVVDISGAGTTTHSFSCQTLRHVRIQRVIGQGLISVIVYEDGEVVFSTIPSSDDTPIVYVHGLESSSAN
ncbi:MAG: hypothetical protein AAF465_01900 [Pseudomonadota bacterium]